MAQSELEDIRRQLETVKQDAQLLFADLTEAQLWQAPPKGGWSVGECVAHLNVTGKLYADRLEHAIAEARAKGRLSFGPFRYGMLGGFFVRLQEPPVKRKLRAPKVFAPIAPPNKDVVTIFFVLQEELLHLSERAEGLDLARVTVTSPVTRLLRLSLLEAFGVVLAHQRRHLQQAARVKESLRADF